MDLGRGLWLVPRRQCSRGRGVLGSGSCGCRISEAETLLECPSLSPTSRRSEVTDLVEPKERSDDPEREIEVAREWIGPRPSGAQIEAALLSHLRRKLAAPELDYARRPTHLGGGVFSRVFAFRLSGASDQAWSRPLVLRMTLREIGQELDLEQALQNALADVGAPAPRVLLHGGPEARLGAAYTITEQAEGQNVLVVLLASLVVAIGLGALGLVDLGWLVVLLAFWGVMTVTLVRLHAVPVDALERELERAGVHPARLGVEASLDKMEASIDQHELDELRPCLAWLREHCSGGDGAFVICHGDLNPGNLMLSPRGRVRLIDWDRGRIAGREYDLAWMMLLPYGSGPLFNLPLPAWLKELLAWFLRPFLWISSVAIVGLYRLLRRFDRQRLRTYSVYHCLSILIGTAWFRLRVRGGSGAPDHPFGSMSSIALLRGRIRRVTGLRVRFPLRAPR